MRLFALAAAAAAVSFSLLSAPGASAAPGSASGIRQSLDATSTVKQVRRVCRHEFWTSRRVCWTDRSGPPTVCHHLRNSSRRDCY